MTTQRPSRNKQQVVDEVIVRSSPRPRLFENAIPFLSFKEPEQVNHEYLYAHICKHYNRVVERGMAMHISS